MRRFRPAPGSANAVVAASMGLEARLRPARAGWNERRGAQADAALFLDHGVSGLPNFSFVGRQN